MAERDLQGCMPSEEGLLWQGMNSEKQNSPKYHRQHTGCPHIDGKSGKGVELMVATGERQGVHQCW